MADLIGRTISNRYRVDSLLGRGGMGDVYKVWDSQRGVFLAMKVLHADLAEDKVFLRRFAREAETLSTLQHPHIVRFYGLEQEGRLTFMLMDYVEGTTLRGQIFDAEKPFTVEQVLQIIKPVCSALHYAHQMGRVHCDIKPANIMVKSNGDVLVADFGIARMMENSTTMTMAGAGTPAYMAPEQILGKNPVPQTDIYALGVVLYEMLTGGERPFTGEHAETAGSTGEKLRWEKLNLIPPSPRKHNPDVSPRLEAVVLKCLQKKVEDRYADAFSLLNAVSAGIKDDLYEPVAVKGQEPIISRPAKKDEAVERDTKEKKIDSHKKQTSPLVWLIGGVVVILLAAVLGLPALIGKPKQNPTIASIETLKTFTSIPASKTPTLTFTPTQTLTITPTPLPTEITDIKGVQMMLVLAGEFTMGSDNGNPDEKPAHTVYLDSYYIDKYEVTNALYKTCVDAGLCATPQQIKSYKRPMYYGNPEFGDYPVIYVDWNQAVNYCEWRGGSLPTEAQWEKAARGTDGRTYPWGEGIDCNKVNYNVLCTTDTSKVGSYADGKSPYGIFDMAGNVWEWVMDWYDSKYYSTSPSLNPQGPDSGKNKVLRGGSWVFDGSFTPAGNQGGAWYNYIGDLRSSDRGRGILSAVDMSIGFRCARSLP